MESEKVEGLTPEEKDPKVFDATAEFFSKVAERAVLPIIVAGLQTDRVNGTIHIVGRVIARVAELVATTGRIVSPGREELVDKLIEAAAQKMKARVVAGLGDAVATPKNERS